MTVGEFRLFDAELSPAGKRARLALTLAGIPFERIKVDLGLMYQKSFSFLEMVPLGTVPCLVHDGRVVFDSHVIADYILYNNRSISSLQVIDSLLIKELILLEIQLSQTMRPAVYELIGKRRLRENFPTWDAAFESLNSYLVPKYLFVELRRLFFEPIQQDTVNSTREAMQFLLEQVERFWMQHRLSDHHDITLADLTLLPRFSAIAALELYSDPTKFTVIAERQQWLESLSVWKNADVAWTGNFKPFEEKV